MGLRLKQVFQGFPAIRAYASHATATEGAEGRHTNMSELKNGLRVATHNNGRATATIGIWVDSGSRYEQTGNNGVGYFLEHMLYKGTKSRTQKQLESDLAKLGARLDSYTDREHTAYFIQSPSSEVNKVFEILADVIRNPKLDKQDVEVSRQTLLKKLDEHDSCTREKVFNYLHMTGFQGTPLSLSPAGHAKSIQAISVEDLRSFAEESYKPTRMVATAVGGVDHEQISGLTEKLFGDLKGSYEKKIPQALSTVRFTGSEMTYRDDSYPFCYVAFATEGVPQANKDFLPLSLAAQFVGQWDKSHAARANADNSLTQDLSADYEIEAFEGFNLGYKDAGLFGIYSVYKCHHIEYVHDVTRKLQKRLRYLCLAVTDEELDRAKNQYKTRILTNLETNANHANHIAKELLNTGRVTSLGELAKKIQSTTASEVREAMSRNFYDRDLAIARVGRTEGFPDYTWLRMGQSQWRL